MFIIEVPFLNLNQIYESKQSYRWKKVADNKYFIAYKDNILLIQQQKDRLCFICTEEEFYSIWFDYFDMLYDYSEQNYYLRKELKEKAVRCKGLRILQQGFYEVLIQQACIDRKQFSELLKKCGNKRNNSKQGIRIQWHEFPSVDEILSSKENIPKQIIDCCKDIKAGIFDGIEDMNLKDALELLCSQYYLDKEKALNICLYGLNKKDGYKGIKYAYKSFLKKVDKKYLLYE